jgi:hypothetical protein
MRRDVQVWTPFRLLKLNLLVCYRIPWTGAAVSWLSCARRLWGFRGVARAESGEGVEHRWRTLGLGIGERRPAAGPCIAWPAQQLQQR